MFQIMCINPSLITYDRGMRLLVHLVICAGGRVNVLKGEGGTLLHIMILKIVLKIYKYRRYFTVDQL